MKNKTFFYIVITLVSVYVLFVIFAIVFRNMLKDYGAVASSISTVTILFVNIIIVTINMQNLSFNQNPVVVISFERIAAHEGAFCFRNIGKSAAIVKSIEIDRAWLENFFANNVQITENEKKFLRELKRTHIVLPPDEEFYIKPYFEPQRIIDSQHTNNVSVHLVFENISKRRYEKTINFDFAQFNDMIQFKL